MATGDHWSGNGNGAEPEGCDLARVANTTATKAYSGVFEVHGLVEGVRRDLTEKMITGFEMMGAKGIRERYAEMDAQRERAREEEAQRDKMPSADDLRKFTETMEEATDALKEASERFDRADGHIATVEKKTHSDKPEQLAKKVSLGFVILAWKGVRTAAKEAAIAHGVKAVFLLVIAGAVMAGNYLHILLERLHQAGILK